MTYKIINIDLSIPRINEVYNLTGDCIKVINATSDCFIQFDDTTQDPINLLLVDEIKIKFKKFYISNIGVENQSIKIVVSENFSLCDRISITDYIPEPIPEPIPTPPGIFIPAQIINITNSEPNVQIELDLSNLNFSEFTDNGSNIRIIDENHNLLPFYLCSFDKTARTGKLFFKTPNSIINSALIYPDILGTPSLSDGETTFEFFDDFKGTIIDTTKWNIVNATGWSVGNGELRGSNTSGRLLSNKLFSDGIILEIKARIVTSASNGHTIGGFWVDTGNGFTAFRRTGVSSIKNNAHWHNIGGAIPLNNIDFLIQFNVLSTTVNLKITRLDTNVMTHNSTRTNSVINEPLMLGQRADNTQLNQTYNAFWDWIRIRKITAATAVIV